MKFNRQQIQDLIREEGDDNGLTWVSEYTTGRSRWHETMHTIFKFNGRFYRADWRKGATEGQENEIYEYGPDEIELPEVWPQEIKKVQFMTYAEGKEYRELKLAKIEAELRALDAQVAKQGAQA